MSLICFLLLKSFVSLLDAFRVKREAHDVSFVFVVCQLIKKDDTSCVSCVTWNASLILYIKKKKQDTYHETSRNGFQ